MTHSNSMRGLVVMLLMGTMLQSPLLVKGFPLARSKTTGMFPNVICSSLSTNVVARQATQDDDSPEAMIQDAHHDDTEKPESRRQILSTLVSACVVVSTLQEGSKQAAAYERTFPVDLDFENGDTSKDLTALREAKIARQKANTKKDMDYVSTDPLTFRGPKDFLTCTLWGGALWLLSGSRSNPLVTPLANALYNQEEEQWLKDRNEGLFASVPPYLLFVLSAVFFFVGVVMDRLLLLATEGDANVSLQLAGVSLIAGGALELGRIFSGEKGQTRQDFDRDVQLEQEFAEFAENRLMPGGNCHRSEVVTAFRRYYAKVRYFLIIIVHSIAHVRSLNIFHLRYSIDKPIVTTIR